ncbi:hypothetical protein [Thermonema rossianum]|jgi:hypothetical protein|uniref:hypothetical protein n=1 Tax=Thermonema rossianum TaxID=55505 RepID=UPI0005714848|nr:hypothetical protein [Thermonema rossianum]
MILRKTKKDASGKPSLYEFTLHERRPSWWWAEWLALGLSLFAFWRFRSPFVKLLSVGSVAWFSTQVWMQLKRLQLQLTAEGLSVREGIIGKKYFFDWADIKQAQILKDNKTLPFGYPSLSQKVIQEADSILLCHSKEKTALKISASRFGAGQFGDFLQRLYRALQWHSTNRVEKIDYLIGKIQEHKQQDLQIMRELEDALFEAYRTAYQPIYLQEGKQASQPLWIYRRGQHPIAFYADHPQANVSEETRQVAEELIKVSRENMEIVKTRLAYYDSVIQVLTEKRKEVEQQQKLKEVAGKLKAIQVRNLKKQETLQSSEEDSLMVENLMLLDELTSKVYQIENLEDSFLLSQYIEQLKPEALAHNQVLRELNEKLQDGHN